MTLKTQPARELHAVTRTELPLRLEPGRPAGINWGCPKEGSDSGDVQVGSEAEPRPLEKRLAGCIHVQAIGVCEEPAHQPDVAMIERGVHSAGSNGSVLH